MLGRKAILGPRDKQGTLAPFQKSAEMLRCLYYVRRSNVKGGLDKSSGLTQETLLYRTKRGFDNPDS